jgi:RNA 2',3'-cyclic 3'-phosphodiesterase
MRVFLGIDLDSGLRDKIAAFLDGVSGFAPDARWVRPESLHITLKFIGEQPPEQVEKIRERLRTVISPPFEIRCAGTGFFPTTKAPRVFWIGVDAGPALATLAQATDKAASELGIPAEERAFSPHMTLARSPGGSGSPKWRRGDGPNSTFALLQKRLAAISGPDFGTMTCREFCLYQSQLSPAGARYTKLEKYPLNQPAS